MPELVTKNESPVSLDPFVTKSIIEPIFSLQVGDVLDDIDLVCEKIYETFKDEKIIIRNSMGNDDNVLFSENNRNGIFTHINAGDKNQLADALQWIVAYYKTCDSKEDIPFGDNYIIVQRQRDDIDIYGVIFTRDAIYNRPYYMVSYNYTDNRGTGKSKTKWIAKNVSREFLEDEFLSLVFAAKEIEAQYEDIDGLDIEFGINRNEEVIIYRVLPMDPDNHRPCPMSDREFIDTKAFAKCNYLDHNNILSDLLFWNPIEIIGANPRPLDFSIYKEVITSSIWNDAIKSFGYFDANGELMYKVGNRPYLSIDEIFNVIIPSSIDEQLKYKLKEYYRDRIRQNRGNHKDVENRLLINTYDFSIDEKITLLKQSGFNNEEVEQITSAISDVTLNMIKGYSDMCIADKKSIDELTTIRRDIRKMNALAETNVMKLYHYISELLDSIKKYGTPQYVRQVRCAYAAKDLLRTMAEKGYISEGEMMSFVENIPTFSKIFDEDFAKYSNGIISREEFDTKYGHLRLGAYDIRSNCYRKMYFDLTPSGFTMYEKPAYVERKHEAPYLDADKVRLALEEIGFDIEPEVLINFIEESIKNVDDFKYEFTKSLSLLLEIIIRLGELHMIAREDMSYLEIQDLEGYHSRESYIEIIEARRNMYYAYSYIVLPEYILNLGDVDVVDAEEKQPYFVTDTCIEAEIVNLDENGDEDINGRIVVLTKADQGYEWIFTKNIAGFIAKYGDDKSYMAKWCKLYGVPAALGCGEVIFKKINSVNVVKLDCKAKKISAIDW